MNAWPFDLWLRYGVGALKISPGEFWAMSVSDWLALTAKQSGWALRRAEFDELINQYPDEVTR